ncbi:MAG: LacI family DNA-binding transcriptional regulator [Oscillospiraceae bacterium]
MNKKISIKDVAQKAGVSISTVSRVFNNGPSVTDETKKRVLQAMEELKYRPNFAAKALRDGSSKTIALIVPSISNPSYAMMAQGLESVVRAKNYNVILCNTNDDVEVELNHIELLKNRYVDGFVFATAKEGDQHIDALIESGMPVVEVMRYTNDANAVTVDNFKIGYEATKYLIDRGHRKIFMFTNTNRNISFRLRADGYRKALSDAGLEEYTFSAPVSGRSSDAEEMCQTALEAINSHGVPDAILCANDSKALGVYGAAKKLGLRIPDDVSVISVDNVDFSQFLDPPLTTFAQPFRAMGEKAGEVLLKEIEAKGTGTEEMRTFYRVVLPTKMIERESVADKNTGC